MFNTDVGKKCIYPYCKQQDFLPFTCQLCSGSYCTEHRTPESHECVREKITKKAIQCPLCGQTLFYQSNQSEDQVWEQHYLQSCSMIKDQKQKCYAQGCKTNLTALNKVKCKECQKEVCLTHRFPENHQCQSLQRVQKVQPNNQIINNRPNLNRDNTNNKNIKAENTAVSQQDANLPEVCEICGKRFPYVMQLIVHSNEHLN